MGWDGYKRRRCCGLAFPHGLASRQGLITQPSPSTPSPSQVQLQTSPTPQAHACHSPPAPCLGACTRRSLAIAFRQSHYSVGRSAADSTMYLRSILLVLTSYYMLDTCVLHRLLYPLDTFTLSPPCICILLSCTHTHTHTRTVDPLCTSHPTPHVSLERHQAPFHLA